MNTKKHILLALPFFALFFLMSSSSPDIYWHGNYSPIFMNRVDLERSVSYHPGERELVQPGKIYHRSPYIFVNEKYKGVHIINNSNPSHPVHEGFVTAPGCMDIAMKGNILYLDNSTDLVAFDLNTKQVTERIVNIFPEPTAPDNQYYGLGGRPENFVIVGWKKTNKNESH